MKEINYTILYFVFVRTFVIPFHYGAVTVINYGSGFVSVFRLFDKLQFRFRFDTAKSYGSDSTTLLF